MSPTSPRIETVRHRDMCEAHQERDGEHCKQYSSPGVPVRQQKPNQAGDGEQFPAGGRKEVIRCLAESGRIFPYSLESDSVSDAWN